MTNEQIDKAMAWLDTEEGKASVTAYVKKLADKQAIEDNQIIRFHEKYSPRMDEIMEKIIGKYNSQEYLKRWLDRGYEPPEPLLFFLELYAQEYGREATIEEYEEHGNMFTSSIYIAHNWYFMIMHGQGTVVKIWKLKT